MDKIVDMLIIGGGPSALALLGEASTPLVGGGPPLQVVVVEKKSTFGGGTPWEAECALDIHTLGRTHNRRLKKGETLRKKFNKAVRDLQNLGHQVRLLANKEVVSLRRSNEEGWKATLDDGTCIHTRAAIVATGHHASAWNGSSRLLPSFWPVSRLDRVVSTDSKVHVLVRGCGQSGVEATLALASKCGEFKGDPKEGPLKFQLHSTCPGLQITMVSRRGLLPRAVGHVEDWSGGEPGSPDLDAWPFPYQDLDDLYRWVCRQLDPGDVQAVYPEWTGESFDADMAAIERDADPVATWRKMLGSARKSVEKKRAVRWVEVLWNATERFFWAMPRFSRADMARLDQHKSTAFSFIEAINLSQAARLEALLDAGVLQVTCSAMEKMVASASGVTLDTSTGGSIVADWCIDCADAAYNCTPQDVPGLWQQLTEEEIVIRQSDARLGVDPLTCQVHRKDRLFLIGPPLHRTLLMYVGLMGGRWIARRILHSFGKTLRKEQSVLVECTKQHVWGSPVWGEQLEAIDSVAVECCRLVHEQPEAVLLHDELAGALEAFRMASCER